jgi:hypothetical protein
VTGLVGARELEQEDPVLVAAHLEKVEQHLARHLDGDRIALGAVEHGGNDPRSTQAAILALAGTFATLDFDRGLVMAVSFWLGWLWRDGGANGRFSTANDQRGAPSCS